MFQDTQWRELPLPSILLKRCVHRIRYLPAQVVPSSFNCLPGHSTSVDEATKAGSHIAIYSVYISNKCQIKLYGWVLGVFMCVLNC